MPPLNRLESRADQTLKLVHLLPKTECLNETLFSSITQTRSVLATWRDDYNRLRPHSALGNAAPAEFAEKIRLAQEAA